jgi:hypothetical protein
MDLHKSGLRAFQGGPNKQNLPLFLCLLIRNLMPFWTNIVLLKPNLKSKFIKKKICEKQGFSGGPRKKLAAPIYAYPWQIHHPRSWKTSRHLFARGWHCLQCEKLCKLKPEAWPTMNRRRFQGKQCYSAIAFWKPAQGEWLSQTYTWMSTSEW